jgi:KDO2-lipid IV(A) lauroyltransferase
VEPRRWTLHGLNNGAVLRATCAGVRALPKAASYAIGDGGAWLASRLMPATRAAIADNLQVVFPGESPAALRRRVRRTLQSYARDTIDLIRAVSLDARGATALFDIQPADRSRLNEVLAQGRGAILVTGHYGNWEIGGVLARRVLQVPLTIVAMAEASADVNRVRREIRDGMGVDTIEVRQSLDTALQIRRRLSENSLIAMLMDRHLGRDRVQVTLLGRPAWFLRTPAVVAYLSGAPLLPCFIQRTESSPAFSASLGDPITVGTDGPRDDAIQQAAQRVADHLTDRIRRHPEYWYQFYRYWDAQQDSYDGLL